VAPLSSTTTSRLSPASCQSPKPYPIAQQPNIPRSSALTQTFLLFFTTEHLLSPTLLDENPDVAPLLLTLPSQLDKLLFTPRLLAPRPHAVLRSARAQAEPFLDAVNVTAGEGEVADVYEELEDADTPFLRVLRLPAVKKLPRDVRFSVLLYMLTLSIVPHMLASWTVASLLPKPEPANPAAAAGLADAAAAVDAEAAREAAAAAVAVTQERGVGAFRIPPEVRLRAADAAAAVGPRVAASAARRARGWREGVLAADVRLQEGRGEGDGAGPHWLLRGGETVVAAEWLAGDDDGWEETVGEMDGPEEMLARAFERRQFLTLPNPFCPSLTISPQSECSTWTACPSSTLACTPPSSPSSSRCTGSSPWRAPRGGTI
jgi:hypothetical protein